MKLCVMKDDWPGHCFARSIFSLGHASRTMTPYIFLMFYDLGFYRKVDIMLIGFCEYNAMQDRIMMYHAKYRLFEATEPTRQGKLGYKLCIEADREAKYDTKDVY